MADILKTEQTLLTGSIPAIAGIEDPSQARMVLYQAGRPVHAPLDQVGLATDTEMAAAIEAAIDATATAETRNRLVNPNFCISQENGNTAGTTTGYYAADQWLTSFATTGAIGIQRVQSVTLNGSKDRLLVQINTADTSLAATEYLQIIQKIEGNKIADFRWGSASAKQVVLRFGFKAPAGTYSVLIQNGAGNRTYLVNFTIAAGQANTDTTQTFIIPGDTTGAWLTDTGIGILLGFGLAVGSNFHGVTGWQAGAFNGTSSNTNGMATLANQFHLSDVSLYCDPLATGIASSWQMPDEAEELRACQRYWQNLVAGGLTMPFGVGLSGTSTSARARLKTFVPMRAVPSITGTISWYQASGAQTPTAFVPYLAAGGFVDVSCTVVAGTSPGVLASSTAVILSSRM